mmetsp:Transcript_16262/g.53530  ORF Transcript_16262/g.53530 Transcript_16262/m.53530 type:complete len:207 (+) Transcript_16262:369-989(+)
MPRLVVAPSQPRRKRRPRVVRIVPQLWLSQRAVRVAQQASAVDTPGEGGGEGGRRRRRAGRHAFQRCRQLGAEQRREGGVAPQRRVRQRGAAQPRGGVGEGGTKVGGEHRPHLCARAVLPRLISEQHEGRNLPTSHPRVAAQRTAHVALHLGGGRLSELVGRPDDGGDAAGGGGGEPGELEQAGAANVDRLHGPLDSARRHPLAAR